MRKTIHNAVLAGLIAATLVPMAAQAQITPSEHRELQRDRQVGGPVFHLHVGQTGLSYGNGRIHERLINRDSR